jgi:hypothetical protein
MATHAPARCLIIAFAVLLAPSAGAQVELRGFAGESPGQVVGVDRSGIRLRMDTPGVGEAPGAGVFRIVGWDRVRLVQGDFAEQARAFAPLADGLWRGRSRLERGDVRAAEELIEPLWAATTDPAGPSGAVLCETTLRVRLLRGRVAGAVLPLLMWRRIPRPTQGAEWVGGQVASAEVIDPVWRLAPRVPAMFHAELHAAGVRWLSDDATWRPLGGKPDDATADLVALYRAAAAFEAGGGLSDLPAPVLRSTDPAVMLMGEIVAARVCSGEVRQRARAALEKRLEAIGTEPPEGSEDAAETPWVEAWCRAAIGRSLLRETEPAQQRLGVVELLHVPARFGDSLGELAQLALADAIAALRKMGEPAAADVLAGELRRLTKELDWTAIEDRTTTEPPPGPAGP